MSPPSHGSRKKEGLLEEEQADQSSGGAEDSQGHMDISLLRKQYRRERHGSHTQVVVLRTGESVW